MSENKRDWTEEQKVLLEMVADPQRGAWPRLDRVAVSADAGAGKTSVLTERVRRFFEAHPKARVLCVSFTEKSKADLKERLSQWPSVEVYTIHGFCMRLIEEFGAMLGLPPVLRVLDGEETEEIFYQAFEKVYRRSPPDSTEHNLETFFRLCRAVREKGSPIHADSQQEQLRAFVQSVLEEFDAAKSASRALEYSDLEKNAVKLVALKEVSAVLQNRYSHVFVDEFQDTSEVQCELVRALSGKKGALFVVGDVKQSIYRFRGADVEVFQEFTKELPERRKLSTNFRSHPDVIEAVNAVCAHALHPAYESMVAGVRDDGTAWPLPRVSRVIADEDAEGIASLVWRLRQDGVEFSDIVLLLPRMRGREALFEELSKQGIAVAASSSGVSTTNPDLSALMNLWVWACEPWQRLRAARVAVDLQDATPANLGEKIEKLISPYESFLSCEDLLSRLEGAFGLRTRFGAVFEQFELFVIGHQAKGLLPSKLARRMQKLTREDLGSPGSLGFSLLPPPPRLKGTVRAMTVHAAKGLEFPCVILADLRGKKPRVRGAILAEKDAIWLAGRDEDDKLLKNEQFEAAAQRELLAETAESARLLYVAMTRAKKALYMIDRPEQPTDSKKTKPQAQESWDSWIQKGVSQALLASQLQQETTRAKQEASAPVSLGLEPLESKSPEYRLARIGATQLVAHEKPVLKEKPKTDRYSVAGDARELGTMIHECLEFRDWERMQSLASKAKLDLGPFLKWKDTAEGQRILGEGQGLRAFPEFAFEWKGAQGVVTGRLDKLVISETEAWIIDYKVLQGSNRSAQDLLNTYAPQMRVYAEAVKSLTRTRLKVRAFLVDVAASTGKLCHEVDILS